MTASHQLSGLVIGPLVGALSAWMVRAYCDKVIKLSPVLQAYAPEKEIVDNVHGIRQEFLDTARPCTGDSPGGNKVYFIGKLLWAKGLDRLLDLQAFHKKKTGNYFAMDVYGSGPEEKAIQRAYLGTAATAATVPAAATAEESEGGSSSGSASSLAASYYAWTPRRKVLPVGFLGRLDHAKVPVTYKIFVNPSVTEVLCTTTAEALAMGKFVIIPNHASNTFFQQFPNCLQYQTKAEFVTLMQYALAHDPEPLSNDLRHTLTWEAATERFLEAAMISERDAARRDRVGKLWDERIVNVHYELGKGHTGDVIRKVMGGGPVADQFKYEQVVSSPTRDDRVLV
jgi:digalactosyldiacylglycerol synthase